MDYTRTSKKSQGVDEIKLAARGRELEILQNVAGIPLESLDGRHHPCPLCGGKDRFRRIDKDAGAVFCNQCFNHDNGDYIAAVQWMKELTFSDTLAAIGEYLNLTPEPAAEYIEFAGVTTSKDEIEVIPDQRGEDLSAYFADCAGRIGETDYLRKRGISDETARRAGVGFDTQEQAIIIPTSAGGYTARTTDPAKTGKDRYRNHGQAGFFNIEALTSPAGPVFIVEGAIDALSIIEAGGDAVGLCSTSMTDKLLDALQIKKPTVPLLITLDNDETGSKAADKLEMGLLNAGLNAFRVDIAGGNKDPNDYLVADREGFAASVHREIGRAEGRTSPAVKADKDSDPLPFVPFPVEALPTGHIRDIAKAYSASVGKDAAYIAPILLAGVASIFGCSRRVQLNSGGDWLAPLIIYSGIVAGSGSGKSPAQKIAQAPFDDIQGELYRDYTNKLQEFKKSDAGKKAADWDDAPQLTECIVTNITVEALADTLFNNPYGVMSFQDELSGWFKGFNQYKRGGNDEAVYLSLFNGTNIKINRKIQFSDGSNVRVISNPALSLAGGIQPDILRRITRENPGYLDSGLLYRFLWTMPPDPIRTKPVKGIGPDERDAYRALVYQLFTKREDDAGRLYAPVNPQVFYLSNEASRLFEALDKENEQERGRRDETTKGILPKLTDYAGRIAGVIHLIKYADKETPDEIDADTMADAVKIVRWFRNEAFRVMELIGHGRGPGEAGQEEERVLTYLQQKGTEGPENGLTAREIGNGLYRGRGSTERAETVLKRLKDAGKVNTRTDKSKAGGPATDRFFLAGT